MDVPKLLQISLLRLIRFLHIILSTNRLYIHLLAYPMGSLVLKDMARQSQIYSVPSRCFGDKIQTGK